MIFLHSSALKGLSATLRDRFLGDETEKSQRVPGILKSAKDLVGCEIVGNYI